MSQKATSASRTSRTTSSCRPPSASAAAAPGAPEYAGYVAHWTAPGFADYVDGLAAAADALGGRHDEVVLEVLDAEVAFWDTAWNAA